MAIFGGKMVVVGGAEKWRCRRKSFWDCFGVVLGAQNTETNVWKMKYDEFFII